MVMVVAVRNVIFLVSAVFQGCLYPLLTCICRSIRPCLYSTVGLGTDICSFIHSFI